MRIVDSMEQYKDSTGWGIIGTIFATMYSTDLVTQMVSAVAVGAAGILATQITKDLYIAGKARLLSWMIRRKTNSNIEKAEDK